MGRLKTTGITIVSVFMCMFISTFTMGDEFQITPYLSVRGEYNDNIFFLAEDEVDDYILTIKPGLELTERTERLNVKLTGEVAPFFYADNSDLNDVDQDYRGRIGYQFTPRFNARADVLFLVDHRPERDILTTGLVQGVGERKRYHVGAGSNYLLSERARVDLSYDFNRDDWDSDFNERENLTSNAGNLGFTYNLEGWLDATTGRVNFGYGHYQYDTSETNSFLGTAGFHRMLSEIFSLQVDVGVRYADSQFDTLEFVVVPPATLQAVVVERSKSGWGGVGQAFLEYRGEKTVSSLLVSHDLSAASGRAGPTQLTRIIFNAYYRVFEKMRIGFLAGYYRNKADEGDFSTQEIDEYLFRVRPSIRWEFFDNFTIEGAYGFTFKKNDLNDTEATRNNVYIQLAYGLPLFEFLDLGTPEGRQVISGAIPVSEPR